MHLAVQQILSQPDPYRSSLGSESETGVFHHISIALQQSVERVLSLLVVILPGLLALLLVLIVFTALGILLSYLLRRVLTGFKFDERMTKNQAAGVAEWSPAHSPTALAGRITFWVCALLGLLIGISTADAAYAPGSLLTTSLLPYLTHVVGAVLILLVGNVIARFLARTVLIGAVNYQLQYARFLSMGVKWLVLVLTTAMALDHLQIGGNIIELAFGILFGGIVLTLSLAVGLGSRELVSRSLERTAERVEPAPLAQTHPMRDSGERLRHF